MKYAIITGASKGLGESIAKRLLQEQIAVVSVSRTKNEELKNFALENGIEYKHVSCNLSLEKEIQEVFMEISHCIFEKNPTDILLFNNAGMIEPIQKVGNLDQTPIIRNIKVNLIAPILITNLFLSKAQLTNTKVTVINVTSGAAVRSIEGWSVYCSSKAGLNMFTQTAAIEQAELKTKNTIIGFSPGVMDTSMQETIRSSSENAFKELEKFKEYKEKNLLLETDAVANALVDLVFRGNPESGRVYHIKELINS
ncbi:short-chain dehydrogenase [Bacillus sp. AFS076308]|uniref:(S)-benzoin forming benzil reductase n=1 Tax=unclassified Bacillus (in: firmicutes) TaxID=185979 RepID=UPI000BF8C95A|nr:MULTISPECIES: (S)-benzoin forming benzil reductase [unclassified Bacillus (in: firmicutes)]PFO02582.1 short-chain dehydrogenase [Bacillus sp. AFS076308]PGV55475.1 short-chain dehydrogenase [Bacillus sp. AFS037270]